LHSGANLVSFRFIDEDNSPAGMFDPLGLNIAKIIGEGEVALQVSEDIWQGNLNELSYEKGYWLIMNEADQLELMGTRFAEEPVYNLHANANLISYPQAFDNEISVAIPDEIETHFTAIIGEGKAALHLENGDWVGNLTHFEKEKAYWVIVDTDVVLDFEEATGERILDEDELEVPEFFAFNQSALQAFFITSEIFINGNELTSEDWIAVYKNDVCIGSSNYIGANTTISAMGNDGNIYSVNYAENNDEISFKVWDASAGSFFICEESVIWESRKIEQITLNSFTSNDGNAVVPLVNSLSQNYPNPFNPTTTISFGLKTDSNVRIDVFNMKGQKVETICDGHKNAGYHSINFVADQYSSGVYFYKISTDGFVKTKKMVLLK
ncbi:MAG: T9SS type A sorting domain-containing protein, partial [Candidatus Cloacimonadota bacterium]|nr:T9SS type A sorting domain-containing protein [Candidatus Cloacimonadota bacterium]